MVSPFGATIKELEHIPASSTYIYTHRTAPETEVEATAGENLCIEQMIEMRSSKDVEA
jgi:hypothetical protein